jgi:hypothetical protein
MRSAKVLGVVAVVVMTCAAVPRASAAWRSGEPACDPSQQPGTPRTYALSGLPKADGATDWVEPWAEWWSACTTAAEGDAPPLCQDGASQRAAGRDGGCLLFTCRSGAYDIRSCAAAGGEALPRIVSLRLFPGGYAALIEHRKGSKEDFLDPAELPLNAALRALMSGARLPQPDLRAVPASFWQRQRPIAVVTRSASPAPASLVTTQSPRPAATAALQAGRR